MSPTEMNGLSHWISQALTRRVKELAERYETPMPRLGLFGDEYGSEDSAGVSPTEREFDHAGESGKTRLVYVKGADDKAKHPKMRALIQRAGGGVRRGS